MPIQDIKGTLLFRLLLIILFFSTSLFSQKKNNANVYIDFAQFNGNEEVTILEIYYSLPRTIIEHIESEGEVIGQYKFKCRVFIEKDSLLNEISWGGEDRVNSISQISSDQTVNDYHLLLLKPGLYDLEVLLFTREDEIRHRKMETIEIKDFSTSKLKVSDMQMCSQIEVANESNRFVKNGYKLTFNPSTIFGDKWPILYYYAEIYNLSELENETDSTFSAYTIIRNIDSKEIVTSPEIKKIRVGESVVQIGQIYIGSLYSGAYELELVVSDNYLDDSVTTSKRFFVYRPDDYLSVSNIQVDELSALDQIYLGLSEEELDYEFELARYLTSSEERDMYENLNEVGKREYLSKFWEQRNSQNFENEKHFRDLYLDRVNYANIRYSVGNKEGWETDPGRVILLYGKPDEFDRYTSSATMNQYEIWEYQNIEGGIEFVFVEISGYSEFRLVHSTAVNEIQDYDWKQRYLQK